MSNQPNINISLDDDRFLRKIILFVVIGKFRYYLTYNVIMRCSITWIQGMTWIRGVSIFNLRSPRHPPGPRVSPAPNYLAATSRLTPLCSRFALLPPISEASPFASFARCWVALLSHTVRKYPTLKSAKTTRAPSMVVEMTCVDLSAFWTAKAETATTKVRIVQSRRATGNDKRQA